MYIGRSFGSFHVASCPHTCTQTTWKLICATWKLCKLFVLWYLFKRIFPTLLRLSILEEASVASTSHLVHTPAHKQHGSLFVLHGNYANWKKLFVLWYLFKRIFPTLLRLSILEEASVASTSHLVHTPAHKQHGSLFVLHGSYANLKKLFVLWYLFKRIFPTLFRLSILEEASVASTSHLVHTPAHKQHGS